MEYEIGKPPKIPLVKEYKGADRDLTDKRLPIDCAMSAASTLPLKKDLLSVPLLVQGQSSTQKFVMLELASLKQGSYQLFLKLQKIKYVNGI